MKRLLVFLVVIAVFCGSDAIAAPKQIRGTVYKFVDSDGTVHYTTVKPKGIPSVKEVFSYLETAPGSLWISLGSQPDGAEMLVNSKDRKRDGDIATIWVLVNFPKVTVMPGTQISLRSYIELWTVNCKTEQTWITERTGYTELSGAGDVVGQWRFEPQPSTAIPGTFGAAIAKEACQISPSAKPEESDQKSSE